MLCHSAGSRFARLVALLATNGTLEHVLAFAAEPCWTVLYCLATQQSALKSTGSILPCGGSLHEYVPTWCHLLSGVGRHQFHRGCVHAGYAKSPDSSRDRRG